MNRVEELFIKALDRAVELTKKGYELTDGDKKTWYKDFAMYSKQAEQDLALTWKDIEFIANTVWNLRIHNDGSMNDKPIYEETLRRFNSKREERK